MEELKKEFFERFVNESVVEHQTINQFYDNNPIEVWQFIEGTPVALS